MKNIFYQKVDLRSKNEMIKFLANHFRYDTMNSWNSNTSYANNLKINNVIPIKYLDKAFQLLETEEFHSQIKDIMDLFDEAHEYAYQLGFNGRSGGYLVLYKGYVETNILFEFEDSKQYNDRDYENGYGWLSLEEAKKRGLYKKQVKKIKTQMNTIDSNDEEDFIDWNMEQLRQRVKLIQEFDLVCDEIVEFTVNMCKDDNVQVIDEEYFVPKTRKVLVCE